AAAYIREVAGRIILVQLHVAEQPRTGVASLQQVMTKNPVFGEAPLEGLFERLDVIDPLADERAFLEEVLVDVGDGARIGIDTGLAPEKPRIPGPVRAGEAGGHARLQNAVTLTNPLLGLVVTRTVQRVRHAAHQMPRRIA